MTKTIAALLAVLVGALGAPAWAQVRVHDSMVRMVPPGQPISVAFMTLHNHGMDEKILVKVHSDVAGAADRVVGLASRLRHRQKTVTAVPWPTCSRLTVPASRQPCCVKDWPAQW